MFHRYINFIVILYNEIFIKQKNIKFIITFCIVLGFIMSTLFLGLTYYKQTQNVIEGKRTRRRRRQSESENTDRRQSESEEKKDVISAAEKIGELRT